jgi:hypothetical protein
MLPAWVNPEIEARIDPSELITAPPGWAGAIEVLSEQLGCEIVAYRPRARGRPGGLCHHYQVAELAASQLCGLPALERAIETAALVAYRRPPRHR